MTQPAPVASPLSVVRVYSRTGMNTPAPTSGPATVPTPPMMATMMMSMFRSSRSVDIGSM
jgi:hypothetical protein